LKLFFSVFGMCRNGRYTEHIVCMCIHFVLHSLSETCTGVNLLEMESYLIFIDKTN
jgi:hypothetical protein